MTWYLKVLKFTSDKIAVMIITTVGTAVGDAVYDICSPHIKKWVETHIGLSDEELEELEKDIDNQA